MRVPLPFDRHRAGAVQSGDPVSTLRSRRAEGVGKDEKITESDRPIAIQIIPRAIPYIPLTEPELLGKLQKIAKPDSTVAIEVGRPSTLF